MPASPSHALSLSPFGGAPHACPCSSNGPSRGAHTCRPRFRLHRSVISSFRPPQPRDPATDRAAAASDRLSISGKMPKRTEREKKERGAARFSPPTFPFAGSPAPRMRSSAPAAA
ncbi:hypothetical protein ZWY2020_043545 [Hordeum vulgare]|nr:hypothetical protein ZWY2020_043545 [Hordeum vulgare]